MPSPAHRTLFAVWEGVFAPALTRPGFANFVVIATGWVLTRGAHAVTEALVQTGVAGRRHHEAFHRFFSRGTWDPDRLGRRVWWRTGSSATRALGTPSCRSSECATARRSTSC